MTGRIAPLLHRILFVSSCCAATTVGIACSGRVIVTMVAASDTDAASDAHASPTSSSSSFSSSSSSGSSSSNDVSVDGGSSDLPIDDDDAGDASAPNCVSVGDGGYYGGGACASDVYIQCKQPISYQECPSVCPRGPLDSGAFCNPVNDAGLYHCIWGCGGGRRPEGFVHSNDAHQSPVGAFFANLAELEAASIDAFEILARELALHDAPETLQRASRRSARDEVRHARITAAIARRHGGVPRSSRTMHHPQALMRSLETIAIENAAEGCVRETFGALVALAQAENASDPVIRKAMRRIAEDETRHAELSWAIHAWALSLLDADQRSRVERAMMAAIDELNSAPHPDLVDVAGLPSPAVLSRMIAELRASIWALEFTAAAA